MYSYKLIEDFYGSVNSVKRSDGWFIPFDTANSMYQQFKLDVDAGAELYAPDDALMTPEEAKAYVKELP